MSFYESRPGKFLTYCTGICLVSIGIGLGASMCVSSLRSNEETRSIYLDEETEYREIQRLGVIKEGLEKISQDDRGKILIELARDSPFQESKRAEK